MLQFWLKLIVIVFLAFFVNSFSNAQSIDGLLFHWNFEEESGLEIQDISGNNINAIISGDAQRVNDSSDGEGKSIRIADYNQFVQSNDFGIMPQDTSSFTVSYWVKYEDFSKTGGDNSISDIFFQKLITYRSGVGWLSYGFRSGFDRSLKGTSFTLGFGNNSACNSPIVLDSKNGPLSLNQWHHIVFSWNHDTREAVINVDGELAVSQTYSNLGVGCTFTPPTNQKFIAGAGNLGFRGLIDEVKVYTKVLGQEEITNIFNSGQPTGGSGTTGGSPGVSVSTSTATSTNTGGGDDNNLRTYIYSTPSRISVSDKAQTIAFETSILNDSLRSNRISAYNVDSDDIQGVPSEIPVSAEVFFGEPSITRGGRYIAFEKFGSPGCEDCGNDSLYSHILVFDRQTDDLFQIDLTSSGDQADGDSSNPFISSDGRYVVFESDADNLVSGDGNSRDIFLFDRQDQKFKLISIGSDDDSFNSSISSGGRYVVFESKSDSLVSGDNNGFLDIFLRDRQGNKTVLVSGGGNGNSINPSLSSNGRFIAFESDASNLIGSDDNNNTDVFMYDSSDGDIWRINFDSVCTDLYPNASRCRLYNPTLSADGSRIAFEVAVEDGSETIGWDVYAFDQVTGELVLVSINDDSRGGNGFSILPALAPDGNSLAFYSNATDLSLDEVDDSGIFIANSIFSLRTIDEIPSGDGQGGSWRRTSQEDLIISTSASSTSVLNELFGNDFTQQILNLERTIKNTFDDIVSNQVSYNTAQGVIAVGVASNATLLIAGRLLSMRFAWLDLWFILIRAWSSILSWLGLKKRSKSWGTVFDSVTKHPIDPALVTLVDDKGQEVKEAITDLDGRYGFMVGPGIYTIKAQKTNYQFPSNSMKGIFSDVLYDNLYFGEKIIIGSLGEVINKNIPMDPIGKDWNQIAKEKVGNVVFFSNFDMFLSRISPWLAYLGVLASLFFVIATNSLTDKVLLILSVAMVIGRIATPNLGWYGKVEGKDGKPLSFALVQAISPVLGTPVAKSVTDELGRYYLLVPKGQYSIKVQQKQDDGEYLDVYTSEVFEANKGRINKEIVI